MDGQEFLSLHGVCRVEEADLVLHQSDAGWALDTLQSDAGWDLDWGFLQLAPTPLFCRDNQLAIKMVNARISTDRSRHILIQDFAIQEWNDAGDPSDDLTKPRGWILHARHARHTLDGSFWVLICFRFFSPDMAFLPSPFCLLSSRSIFVITCPP
jgi:hypothetical protein